MLPEIQFIRGSDSPVSPNDIRAEFPDKTVHAIRMSIHRALSRKMIKRVSYGLYAHPKYRSPIDKANEPCLIPGHEMDGLIHYLIRSTVIDSEATSNLTCKGHEILMTRWEKLTNEPFPSELSLKHLIFTYPSSTIAQDYIKDDS